MQDSSVLYYSTCLCSATCPLVLNCRGESESFDSQIVGCTFTLFIIKLNFCYSLRVLLLLPDPDSVVIWDLISSDFCRYLASSTELLNALAQYVEKGYLPE